jgi:hypothetical protein
MALPAGTAWGMHQIGMHPTGRFFKDAHCSNPLPAPPAAAILHPSRFGVTAALVDLIDAPQLVKHVLSGGASALASAMFTANEAQVQDLLRWGQGLRETTQPQVGACGF